MQEQINQCHGGKLRLRVCALIVQEQKLLLLKHKGLGPLWHLWLPPGGGCEYGQSLTQNLQRELLEETGLQISPGQLAYVHEHLVPPLHAVELFYFAEITGGTLSIGADPEYPEDQQIITDLQWMNKQEINALDKQEKHAVLAQREPIEAILGRQSLFKKR